MSRGTARVAGVLIALVGTGCGAGPATMSVPDPTCLVEPPLGGIPGDTITILISDPAGTEPGPFGSGRRLLARLLDSTPAPADCLGRPSATDRTDASARFVADGGSGDEARWRLRRVGPGRPSVVLLEVSGERDLRDDLDRRNGVDIAVTRHPTTLAYASARSGFRVVPLPWDRVYGLVTVGPREVALTLADMASLARDAVRSETRAAEPPFWWGADSSCWGPAPVVRPKSSTIGYPTGDAVAKDLAERIAALTPGAPVVVPLRARAVDSALLTAQVALAVVALPVRAPASCAGLPRLPRGPLPLVESRARLVLGPRAPALRLDQDGMFRIAGGARP